MKLQQQRIYKTEWADEQVMGRNGRMKYSIFDFGIMVAVSVGEVLLGTIVERLCGIEYWNYASLPMHVTKYTSVPTSAGFASKKIGRAHV